MYDLQINTMKKVVIYTDGACSGNPGKGGWCAILIYDNNGIQVRKSKSEGKNDTTNNQMELTAVIEAMSVLKEPVDIDLFSDSKYVIDGATKWLSGWIANGWKTSNKKPVANKELWVKLSSLLSQHQVNWNWVKGHSDNEFNNKCDEIARKLAKQ